ncbi:arginine--tRNA ligase [Enterobacteriaceae endosymbiont of Donacia bicoloricornis]|uniref:arginine--tRNA ligase n=1 Tax=Enterobacteriaceae endosymbiont of Donacia bicoloricornis TaxID=2675772 RepID=UPI001449E9CF|nr:arginine--tRNA ligase [Enterobacteriaceae endosymbiont of Donacia bicoloricornis]QJC37917.1 arginine--tRNA ligase [Enterobacteriaceae endosymbiont of Donacia bicoloricornis]
MNIKKLLSKKIHQSMIQAGIPKKYNVILRSCKIKELGHYQINGIISAAIDLNINVNDLAIKVVKYLNLKKIVSKITISKLGFINLFIKKKWLSKQINLLITSKTLGLTKKIVSENIVIDYSSPNIAKEMHVGHLRSTIIGDSIVRILSFVGHNVIKSNHIGDWGTNFGILIAFLKLNNKKLNLLLSDIEKLYKQAQKKYIEDINFAKKARLYVVKLQNKDLSCLKIWKKIVDITMDYNYQLYKKLDIKLTCFDTMGESTYNNMLSNIIIDLKKKGIAINNNGTIIIPIEGMKNIKGGLMAVIIQKKDGAYLYATTDIACIKYRYEKFKANRIIYYVDARQNQYLKQIFHIVKKAKYVSSNVKLEHHMFGMILNNKNKPFKTREGKNIKLNDLINKSILKAKNIILKKNPFLNKNMLENLSYKIGIGAIKYADLSKNRINNYIFNWDKMLSLHGNTSLYIQYAYVRAISLLKKSNVNLKNFLDLEICFINHYEFDLAISFLDFEEIILKIVNEGTPHILCNWLYKITVLFTSFYENCNILNINNKILKISRLKIVFLTSLFLKKGLYLLGIKTIKKI